MPTRDQNAERPGVQGPGDGGEPLEVMLLSLEYGPNVSGGVGTHAREVAEGLARRGHRVEVVAYSPRKQEVERRENLVVHHIVPSGDLHSRVSRMSMVESLLGFNQDVVAYARPLIERMSRRPDVIQHFNWMTFTAAQELGETFGVPALGRFSFLAEPTERHWGKVPDPEMVEQERRVFAEGRHFFAVSHSLARLIAARHPVEESAIPVVHNGVNLERFARFELEPETLRRLRRTITPDGEKLVVFAGRLHPQKGVPDLLRSAARVVAELPDVRYLLIGEPDSRDYRRVIDGVLDDHPAVKERTTFLGRLPRPRVAKLLQAADVVTMPSIYEPFSWIGIEAQAARSALVATSAGGTSELILDGETGFLVPVVEAGDGGGRAVDVEALAERQLRLLRDEELAGRMAEAGRRRVERHFSCEVMLDNVLNVYRRTVAAHAAGRA